MERFPAAIVDREDERVAQQPHTVQVRAKVAARQRGGRGGTKLLQAEQPGGQGPSQACLIISSSSVAPGATQVVVKMMAFLAGDAVRRSHAASVALVSTYSRGTRVGRSPGA